MTEMQIFKSNGTWTYTFDTENHLLSASETGTSTLQLSSAGTVTSQHMDRIGSVVALTNSAGAVTAKSALSPFGEGTPASGTTFGFSGQRYDAETGLFYYKRRQYSPSIGRFLQADSIRGMNLYAYVDNDPLKQNDPLGRSIVTLTPWLSPEPLTPPPGNGPLGPDLPLPPDGGAAGGDTTNSGGSDGPMDDSGIVMQNEDDDDGSDDGNGSKPGDEGETGNVVDTEYGPFDEHYIDREFDFDRPSLQEMRDAYDYGEDEGRSPNSDRNRYTDGNVTVYADPVTGVIYGGYYNEVVSR